MGKWKAIIGPKIQSICGTLANCATTPACLIPPRPSSIKAKAHSSASSPPPSHKYYLLLTVMIKIELAATRILQPEGGGTHSLLSR